MIIIVKNYIFHFFIKDKFYILDILLFEFIIN